MKTVHTMAAQGDVLFRRVPQAPEGEVLKPEDGKHIVAHSETGHHHFLMAVGATRTAHPTDPDICYLALEDDADVIHARDYDTHQTLRLTKGTWEVRRQREWTPEGLRRVED